MGHERTGTEPGSGIDGCKARKGREVRTEARRQSRRNSSWEGCSVPAREHREGAITTGPTPRRWSRYRCAPTSVMHKAPGAHERLRVYEAVLERVLFDNLVPRIESVIDAGADRVAIYPLCAGCAGRRVGLGTAGREWPGREVVFVV